MNIFTPEYIVLAAVVLIALYHLFKKPKSDGANDKSNR
jgi:hypothetical protein